MLDDELNRYLAMPPDERWRWLAKLLFALTLLARGTYTVGGTGLEQLERLRLFNELQHRIASQLRDKATSHQGMPDDTLVKALADALSPLDADTSALIGRLK